MSLEIGKSIMKRGFWTPHSLFSNNEEGAWFDPSDLSTLFQDYRANNPVVTDGDPVGLMLDKRLGLTLGGELVTNGTFDTDINGWSNPAPNRGDILWVSPGYLRIDGTNSDGGSPVARQTISLPANSSYEISWQVPSTTVVNGGDQFQVSSNDGFDGVTAIDGVYKVIIHPTVDVTWVQFYGVAFEIVDIDNISVRELPGNHAIQSTSANRPVYRTDGTLHWIEFDGVNDTLVIPGSSTSMKFLHDGTGGGLAAAIRFSSGGEFQPVFMSTTSSTSSTGFEMDRIDRGAESEDNGYRISVLRGVKGTIGASVNENISDIMQDVNYVFRSNYQNMSQADDLEFYVDGVKKAQTATTSPPDTGPSTNDLSIMGGAGSFFTNGRFYAGIIRENGVRGSTGNKLDTHLAKKSGVDL